MDFKTKPFDHQRECLAAIGERPYYALFLEPGLGKTKISVDLIANRKTRYEKYPTLVVCPNTLVENWADEIVKHSDLSYTALTGSRKRRLSRLAEEKDVYIINYESTRLLVKELILKEFFCLILDESTAVKNPKSQQSKACFQISQHIDHKYILTGTPIMNSPMDIFGQYRILNPNIFGTSFYKFKFQYAIWGGYGNYNVVKYINMRDFRARMAKCCVHKTKEDCLDLPDKLYQVIKLDLPKPQRDVYDSLKAGFIAEFRDSVVTAPVVLTRLIRFSQLTAGFTKDVEGDEHEFEINPKIQWAIDFIKNTKPSVKVVLFCRFKKEISLLEEALFENGISFVRVSGETTDRIDKVKRFNTEPEVKVFIGQLQTAGIGINLTSASYVLFMSNSYSYGERVQAEDRCHRIGQTNNVTYIDLLMKNTVDIAIHQTLRRKENLANMVVGDIVSMV